MQDQMAERSSPGDMLRFVQSVEYPWFPGAIFPSEMAFFLFQCEVAGVDCLIESGRQDGYSTAVIAAYAQAKRIHAASIDVERDPARAAACRERLRWFTNLELVVGNTFTELPSLLNSQKQRIALLIDGPKRHEAIYLSAAAAALGPIRLVAHHSGTPETDWYPHFAYRFPNPRYLEDSALPQSAAFEAFRRWEEALVGQPIAHSGLVLSVLPQPGPSPRYLSGPSPRRTLSAMVWYWWWKLGCPGGGSFLTFRGSIGRVAYAFGYGR